MKITIEDAEKVKVDVQGFLKMTGEYTARFKEAPENSRRRS